MNNKETWNVNELNLIPDDATIYYTDGSRTSDGSGSGVFNNNHKEHAALGKYATITQAEIFAIELCARNIIKEKHDRKKIYILTDSTTAIKILSKNIITSKLALNCLSTLKQCSVNNELTLFWVPAHTNIEGNEKADKLAKKGSDTPFIGPEPAFGIPLTSFKAANKNWLLNQSNNHWNKSETAKEAKLLIGNHSKKNTDKLLSLKRADIQTLTAFLTGHGAFNYRLNKMKIINEDNCRKCNKQEETATHFLCACDAFAFTRLRHLGIAYPKPDNYKKFDLDKIIKVVDKININLGGIMNR